MHLIEENDAKEALDAAVMKWPRAQDAWDTVTLVVINDPKEGRPINESGSLRSFTYVGARSIGMPDVTIIYELKGETTHIHDAMFKDATYAQAGHA